MTLAAILALVVTPAFARQLTTAPNASPIFAPVLYTTSSGNVGFAGGPSSTNNDDSCDIGVAPAATLLLPYFEVDLGTAGTGRTTIFSVTNVSPYPQIAHVTVWTDFSFPVLDFNLFLTGYDVQPINMYDVVARGLIGGTTGTSYQAPNSFNSSGQTLNPPGATPQVDANGFNLSNPNFGSTAAAQCAPGRLPGQLPAPLAADVRSMLSVGRPSGAGVFANCTSSNLPYGSNHGATTAAGYVTIDVSSTCSTTLPTTPTYYTGEILFDNVLIGDYQDINQSATAGNYAGGNPLVHIRAIPEGGSAGSTVATNLPFTFYDRYTTTVAQDRRQPLPSTFAARWISGTTAAFDTQYKIWREGFTGPDTVTTCGEYSAQNASMGIAELVRFDERENAAILGGTLIVSPPPAGAPGLPEASRTPVSSSNFPQITTTDAGGWMYLNLSNGGAASAPAGADNPYRSQIAGYGAAGRRNVSQNWTIVSMFAEGRYGVDYDAAWMGNGCSGPISASTSTTRIAPAGGVLVCQPGSEPALVQATNCQGTNWTPVPLSNTTIPVFLP